MKKENKAFAVLQRIGRSFMLPIALLPIAGLLLGVGSSLTNATTVSAYHLERILGEGRFLNGLMTIFADTGNIVFTNLPLIFAMGVALGMAKREQATAVLSAAIAFFVMHSTISALLAISGQAQALPEGAVGNVVGIESLEMGVFGGIIVGLGVAWLHNRFYKIELPTVISFFGGTRFVPIVSTFAYIAVGALMFFVWPYVQEAIYSLGALVLNSGYFGTFIYGVIERALIPFGLHHVFYIPFWQTGVGGSMMIDGQTVYGAQNIFFAQLASANTAEFASSATRFMSGKFPLMIFGLPGAALAMYSAAKKSKKKVAGGLLLSAALTSMITGITEPLEFTFLFVAPVLYGIHCVFAGIAYMLMHIFNVGVGMTFSGGIIDLLLFGILQGNAKTHWINILWVGAVYFAVYYAVFLFMIRKFNYITPGREDDEADTKLYTRADVNAAKENKAEKILAALGGRGNLKTLDCCATRLRLTVTDASLVSESALRETGAAGVIISGDGVQVIYGPRVTVIKSEIEDYIEHKKE